MPKGARNWLTPAAWVAAVSGVLLLIFPVGFPNYDTIYALVWGRELAHLESPDMGAALPPTPHPLTELWGLATTPLGDGMITLTMIGAYVSLGLIGYFVYRLGEIWFDRWIGGVAAAIVLTRAPFLSNGLRAYIDLPYIALCLAALLVEAKKPKAGRPVLALLALAGLLRPEAWLFAIAYLAYLSFDQRSVKGEKDSLERADTQNSGLIRPLF
ncbi:MAG TPA: glycosyltransferase family 39 protein [Solirubrobacterales bacterium]